MYIVKFWRKSVARRTFSGRRSSKKFSLSCDKFWTRSPSFFLLYNRIRVKAKTRNSNHSYGHVITDVRSDIKGNRSHHRGCVVAREVPCPLICKSLVMCPSPAHKSLPRALRARKGLIAICKSHCMCHDSVHGLYNVYTRKHIHIHTHARTHACTHARIPLVATSISDCDPHWLHYLSIENGYMAIQTQRGIWNVFINELTTFAREKC